MVWWAHPAFEGAVFLGAWIATGHFLGSALPIRYGAGFGGSRESDGRVIWRLMAGAPPGGIAREERRMGEPERAARPLYIVLLAIVGILTFLVDPAMCLALAGLFGFAAVLQRSG